SIVTPLTLDFESGEVYYARVNAADSTMYTSVPVSDIDFAIKEETWYTVTLFINGTKGSCNFTLESESGNRYESSAISLGEAEYINELNPSFTTLPISSGASCYIDDVEFYPGTFIRGDEDIYEVTVNTLAGIATLLDEELDFDTKLKIVKVYEAIIDSSFTPSFSNKYDKAYVVALYESAKAYIPATYTEIFCEEAASIDSGKSYARRQDKLVELEAYFPVINGESFYLDNINAQITELENKVFADFDSAISENQRRESGLTAEEIKALDEELEALKASRADAEKAFDVYKIALTKKENSDTRVDALSDTLSDLIADFESSTELLYDAIDVITENEELLAKLIAAIDAYNAEIKNLEEVKKDSEAFISYMKTYNPDSRDYTYILDSYAQLKECKLRDNSYNYSYNSPSCVYYYIPTYEALEKRVSEMNSVINKFKESVLIMQEPDADFNRIFNVGYVSAKSVYNDGKIYEGVDVETVPGLIADIAKYLEIEAGFSVTIDACENFITSVNVAEFNTLYENKKTALIAAKQLMETDTNINDAYPGVLDAKAKIATIEEEIKVIEDAAAAYIAAVAEIGTKTNFYTKKAAIDKALALQAAGNVLGIAGVAEANNAILNYSAEIQILEGNSKTFIESVSKLENTSLTLAERRELIIVAESAKVGVEPTYDGVSAASAALVEYKEAYKASVEAINSAFSCEIANVSTVAGASANQNRYYSVIELVKLIVASFK
ncbi:MAG: hypothetical protein IJW38_03350, partial [Clostridia bacterium]|nr:hypothetical protein [Clostridia bacterium]